MNNTPSKEAKAAAEAILYDPLPFAKEGFSVRVAGIIDRLACEPLRQELARVTAERDAQKEEARGAKHANDALNEDRQTLRARVALLEKQEAMQREGCDSNYNGMIEEREKAIAAEARVTVLTEQLARFQQQDGACAQVRLEQAEQRNAELEAALRDAADSMDGWEMRVGFRMDGVSRLCDTINATGSEAKEAAAKIRAVLAQAESATPADPFPCRSDPRRKGTDYKATAAEHRKQAERAGGAK